MTGRGRVAGEGIAITLVEICVAVTQIEGEHLPGQTEPDVPGVIVLVVDAAGAVRKAADP